MLIKYSAIYSVSNLINGIIGFVAVALNTRLLGADEYGHYALAFSAAMFISTFFFEWLRLSLTRFSESGDGAKLISTSLTLYMGGGAIILSIGAILFLLQLNSYFPEFGWIAVGLFAVCFGFTDLFLSLARASLKPFLYFSMQATRGVLALILGGGAAWAGYGFVGLLIGMAVANIITLIHGFIRHPAWQSIRPNIPNKNSLKTLMQFGLPIVLSTATMQVLLVLDRYTLSYFHGAAAVGAYAAAGDITQKLILMLAAGINMAAYNITLKIFETEGRAATENHLGIVLSIILSAVLPVVVGVALVANPLGHLLLGANVADEAVRLMPLLAISALLQTMRSYFIEQPYFILKMTSGLFLPYGVAAVVSIISWWWLVPSLGGYGIIYGLMLGHIAGGLFSFLGMHKKFDFQIQWKNVYIIMIAIMGMAATVGIPSWPEGNVWLFIRIGAGAVVYGSILLVANFLDMRTLVFKKLNIN